MKNITTFAVVAAILFILTAASAAALSVSPATLQMGDSNSKASNSLTDVTDSKNYYVTGSVTITNDGTEAIKDLRLGTITTKLGYTQVDLQVNATFSQTVLPNGSSTTATFTVRVPDKLDAITASNLAAAAFNVADATILATGNQTGTAYSSMTQVFLQRKNELRIKEVEVCVNENCKTVRDNGDVSGLRPGDKVDLRVIVENRYSSGDREDLDIDDSDLEISIDDSDFDVNDRTTLSTIGADSETEETFSFDVDDSVREGSYKLTVRVFGRDELGALHGEESDIRLKVERDSHDIAIRRATVSPGTFPCTQTTARSGRVTISAANIGRQDETKAALEVSCPELGIKERIESLQMDRDNSRTESIPFTIPDTAKPGTYQLNVKSFWGNTAQSQATQVPIVLAECTGTTPATQQPATQQPATQQPSTQQPAAQPNAELLARLAALSAQVEDMKNKEAAKTQQPATQTPVTPIVRTTSSDPTKSTALPWVAGFANSGLYIALLSGVIVLIIIVLIALIIKFLAPRA